MTKKYLFLLGNCPQLAKAELEAVNPKDEDDPQKLIKLLGGTVKIAEILPPDIKLSEIIKGDFGISDLTGRIDILKLCKNIKKETGQRYVLPQKGEQQLSSVVVTKQKLTEIVIDNDGTFAKTVAVQDFEDWGKRDYGRPAVQAHLGMIPPKVARMMVNLAVSGKQLADSTILDPFCGVGTILSEALLLDARVIGSDINQSQIERAKSNLDWLARTYNLELGHSQVFVHDATSISRKVSPDSIGAIITEPDLGPTDMDRRNYQLETINSRLAKLYTACLADWNRILKPEGKIVIVLPSFVVRTYLPKIIINTNLVKIIIDKAKVMGYSLSAGPFEYSRPQAIVRRNICVFIKE